RAAQTPPAAATSAAITGIKVMVSCNMARCVSAIRIVFNDQSAPDSSCVSCYAFRLKVEKKFEARQIQNKLFTVDIKSPCWRFEDMFKRWLISANGSSRKADSAAACAWFGTA